MTQKKYHIILADPPWSHTNKVGGSGESGASSNYNTMSMSELCSLNVRSIADDNSFLFMWWVASMPEEAITLVKRWGFQLKTMTCFSWIKQTKNGKDHFGMGFYSRQQQEHCLIARRGNPKILSHSVRQNIRAPIREHSRKPDDARDRIVELCGNVPRLEMFARPPLVKGWDTWGNAVENDVVIPIVSIQDLFARRT